jgi:SAM-dependent methyltransferase
LRATAVQLYGLDLSMGMLNRARSRDRQLYLVRGRAGQLPFPAASFDLVYCVNALHHFDQQRAFVVEAQRLLRPGGALAIIGMDPHGRRADWYVYQFFSGTFATDLGRFPSWGTVLDWMVAIDFERITWQVVDRISDPKVGEAVLKDPFLAKNATSQLALLSDDAYAAGLTRIREALDAAQQAGRQLVFDSEILIGMLVGWVGNK